jgi:hypothetical protein
MPVIVDESHPGWDKAIVEGTHCPPGATNAIHDRTHCLQDEMKAMRDGIHCLPGEKKQCAIGALAQRPRHRATV